MSAKQKILSVNLLWEIISTYSVFFLPFQVNKNVVKTEKVAQEYFTTKISNSQWKNSVGPWKYEHRQNRNNRRNVF